MKILQTPVRFWPAVGGVERYVRDLSTHLVARGHEVLVICADEPPHAPTTVDGVVIQRIPYIGKFANTNITPGLLGAILAHDFDVIHTHVPTPWSAELSILAAKLRRKPCVLTYHNDIDKTGLMGLVTSVYNRTLLHLGLNTVDRIIATQQSYVDESPILRHHRHKVRVVPNAVSAVAANANPRGSRPTVLFVSVLDRFHRYKGLDVLLSALAQVHLAIPDVQLKVVGKGELLAEYASLSRQLGVGDLVEFLGYLDDDALAAHYASDSVFVLPSIDRHEGFGIVLLEAMARGMPVITTDAVGLSQEILRVGAGLQVPRGSASALAEALLTLLPDRPRAAAMGCQGRKLVEANYQWVAVAGQIEEIYRELVDA